MSAVMPPSPALPAPHGPERGAAAWRAWTGPLGVGLIVGSAWLTGRWANLPAGSDAGYWIGVVGGLMMLGLFAYPLRKRVRWLSKAGPTRSWFVAHMVLGGFGPWLILVHCNFRFGSLNAAVALIAMLVVAASGVAGRFLYVRVHRGLSDQRLGLAELKADLHSEQADLRHHLAGVPSARERLHRFEQRVLSAPPSASPLYALGLWWPAHQAMAGVGRDIERALRREPWSLAGPEEHRRLRRVWRGQAKVHVGQVLRVARFASWERLFALWHVLHIPFVYVMVLCAVVHVVAVHAY